MTDPTELIRGSRWLSGAEVNTIVGRLDAGEPLVDAKLFVDLVERMGDESVDPFRALLGLARCSPEAAALCRTDCGLARPCRLHEHIQGGLWIVEHHGPFRFSRAGRTVVRMGSILFDAGKPLCHAVTGEKVEQQVWNVRVASNVLSVLREPGVVLSTPELAPRVLHDAVLALVRQDVPGTAARGRYDFRELAELRRNWPEPLREELDPIVWSLYLGDAGAHSQYAYYRDADTGRMEPCVRWYLRNLTHLFVAGPDGLSLASPFHRRTVERLLPGLPGAPRGLLAPDPGSGTRWDRPAVAGAEIAGVEGAWLAHLRLPPRGVPFEQVALRLARLMAKPTWAFVQERMGTPRSLTLFRDPYATEEPSSSWKHAVEQLVAETSWERVDIEEEEIMVALALGDRRPEEILARLLEIDVEVRTQVDQMLTAPSVDGPPDRRPMFVIRAAARLLPRVLGLALELGEERVTVIDFRGKGRTSVRALARADQSVS
jgi:hypothetical protein